MRLSKARAGVNVIPVLLPLMFVVGHLLILSTHLHVRLVTGLSRDAD